MALPVLSGEAFSPASFFLQAAMLSASEAAIITMRVVLIDIRVFLRRRRAVPRRNGTTRPGTRRYFPYGTPRDPGATLRARARRPPGIQRAGVSDRAWLAGAAESSARGLGAR